jgi:hypothetical protein
MARGRKAKGLGDTIEKITTATGIKTVVDKISEVTGIDCGCDARKEKLNNLIPYHKKVECINETDMQYLNSFFERNPETITIKTQNELKAIYKNIFNVTIADTSCTDCWRGYISDIRRVYNESV